MKGPWKVTSQVIGDYVEDKSIAEFVAKQLNGKEKSPQKAD